MTALGVQILHTWLIQVVFHQQVKMHNLCIQFVLDLLATCTQSVWYLFGICFFRLQWTHRKHVKAQGESLDITRSDIKLDLLRCMRVWTLLHAELRGVATPTTFWTLTAYPQAMTVCQWLLWMWWEWDLLEHAQHKLLVSYNSSCVATLCLNEVFS